MVNDSKNDKEEHSIKNSYTLIGLKIEKFKKVVKKVLHMNGEMYSYDVINRYSDKLFDAVLSIFNPIVNSKNFFRRMHRSVLIHKEISHLSKKKLELISSVLDILPEETTYDSCIEIGKKLEDITKNPDFEQEFEKLNKIFEELTPRERRNLMIHSSKMLNITFSKMENAVTKNLIDTDDAGNMILLGRALQYGGYLTNKLIEILKKRPHDTESMEFHLNCLMILLIKILGIHFQKMKYDDLYSDISFITIYIYEEDPEYFGDLEKVDRSIFSMLGDESV